MANPGALYDSAVGETFFGEVVRPHTINAKTWTVIEIAGGAESFESILSQIYETWEGKIWKGFTGPPDYGNYRIWVELKEEEGVAREFRVSGRKGPFHVALPSYTGHKGYCFIVQQVEDHN